MALAGLFLISFLPVHMIINLMLLKSDPEPFNKAAHFMANFPLIKIVEIILIAAIIIHISWGVFLQIRNWLARPVGYVSGNKSQTSFFSKFMIWTGASILTFLVIHFFNFYFIKLGLVRVILKIFIQLPISFLRSLHTIISILFVLHFWVFIFFTLSPPRFRLLD